VGESEREADEHAEQQQPEVSDARAGAVGSERQSSIHDRAG
jgi:hypothetical protein